MNKQSAWMCAQGMLARREHSLFELKQKLIKKDYDIAEIDLVLVRLQEKGWQSDEKLCEIYIRSKVNNGQGPVKICYDLKQKGISSELIYRYIESYDDDWLNLCQELFQKKFKGQKSKELKVLAQQMRFLSSRGFPTNIIQRVIR